MRPFSSRDVEVHLIGPPGARCVFQTPRAHGDRTWEVEILEQPKNGTVRVTAGKSKVNPEAWIHVYTPSTADSVTDRWIYRACGRKPGGEPTCETHVVDVDLSADAAEKREMVCRTLTPVPVDFATPLATTLAGPRGSDCYFWFPHAPKFWYDFLEKPQRGVLSFERPNLFLYRPSSPEVEADRFKVRVCSEKERVNCSTIDVTVHYGPVTTLR